MLATPMRVPLPEHVEPLYIWEGFPQGDSLLFCSCISFVLMGSLAMLNSSLVPRAYVDDSLLTGTATEMARCLPELVDSLGKAGLPVNAAKTALWSPNPCTIERCPQLEHFHHAHAGLIVCGSPFAAISDDTLPFGSLEFVQQWLHERMQQEHLECRRLATLHHPQVGEFGLQASWTLYPSCIIHILRSLPTRTPCPLSRSCNKCY